MADDGEAATAQEPAPEPAFSHEPADVMVAFDAAAAPLVNHMDHLGVASYHDIRAALGIVRQAVALVMYGAPVPVSVPVPPEEPAEAQHADPQLVDAGGQSDAMLAAEGDPQPGWTGDQPAASDTGTVDPLS